MHAHKELMKTKQMQPEYIIKSTVHTALSSPLAQQYTLSEKRSSTSRVLPYTSAPAVQAPATTSRPGLHAGGSKVRGERSESERRVRVWWRRVKLSSYRHALVRETQREENEHG